MKKKSNVYIFTFQILVLSILGILIVNSSITNFLLNNNTENINLNTSNWSKATVISDDSTLWNKHESNSPSIAVDSSGKVHVVWDDWTHSVGEWGNDDEIMYTTYTGAGWANATVISDIYGWNNGSSYNPSIAVDGTGNVHVFWEDTTVGEWGTDWEIMYANYTTMGWSNATVISDDYTSWNNGGSASSSVAVDNNSNLHVVWRDDTNGEWGTDWEIMYANYTTAGWSNATVISDDSTDWNKGFSDTPSIAVDGNETVHVVWNDDTDSGGEWGIDSEIMYVNYTTSGWSNVTVISDLYGWNSDSSVNPSIAVDGNGTVHVVWEDETIGEWGGGVNDREIMYANYTATGWSNATVISDLYGWNDGSSLYPSITVDSSGNLHIVWQDLTNGEWGGGPGDSEIMYATYNGINWSNATVISDDSTGWNDEDSSEPSIAVEGNGNLHVAWEDSTSGWWGSDLEIMYSKMSSRKPSELSDLIPLTLIIIQKASSFLGDFTIWTLLILLIVILAVGIPLILKIYQENR